MPRTSILIVTSAALLLTGCHKTKTAEHHATPVGVQLVALHDGVSSTRYSTTMQPYEQVDLSFRVSGYIDQVRSVRSADGNSRLIQDGDHVSRGALLARVRDVDYGTRVEQARASLAEAQAHLAHADQDFGRANRLFDSQSLTKPELEGAKANYDAAVAGRDAAAERLKEARVSYSDTQLISPIDGLVVKRNVTMGTLAAPGQPAFVIADTRSVKVVFGVPDLVVAHMKPGQTLQVSTEAFPGEQFTGKITRISASADPRSRVFEVDVTVPNPNERLKIGMIATLVISDDKPAQQLPVVPLSSIVALEQHGKYSVFVIDDQAKNPTAQRREVQLGSAFGNDVAVLHGLNVGEKVITVGANLLTDGEAVQVDSTAAMLVR
jgi:multidrug efflux system membrane fusion protein